MILDQVEIVTPETVGGLNILLYGPSGVGKTVLAASAQDVPEMQPVLFLDIEKGMHSVADRRDISRLRITDPQQVEQVYAALADGQGDYRTLVIDSVNELQDLDMNKRAASRRDRKKTQEMYGESTTYLYNLFKAFKSLDDLNVILIALPDRRYDEETGKLAEVRPALTPKLSLRVMGLQDCVWWMYTRETEGGLKRSLLTQPKGAYQAKTRGVAFAKNLGPRLDDPNMLTIYEALNKANAAEKAA